MVFTTTVCSYLLNNRTYIYVDNITNIYYNLNSSFLIIKVLYYKNLFYYHLYYSRYDFSPNVSLEFSRIKTLVIM